MIRITRDPSAGSFIQCLANITIMVLSCPLTFHRQCLSRQCSTDTHHSSASLDSAVHTHITGKYAAITPTTSMPTDTIEPLLQF